MSTKKRLITDFFAQTKAQKTKSTSKPTVNHSSTENTQSIKDEEKKILQPKESASSISTATFNNFDKEKWLSTLNEEQRELLDLEIRTLDISWLSYLHKTLTKPYFLELKKFLKSQHGKVVFPPEKDIYSWSRLTPLPKVRCLILGQDPYHNYNQAHGLAFSVLEPTRPPPSLVNIYKALKIDYPNFEIPEFESLKRLGTPGGGNLTKWAERGVLMLNTCLTVEAHKANSHANQGWETFTEEVLRVAFEYHSKKSGFVVMAWGSPAQKRIQKLSFDSSKFLILKSVHPSPLSAHRGFFDAHVFKKCNDWLQKKGQKRIDWGVMKDNVVL